MMLNLIIVLICLVMVAVIAICPAQHEPFDDAW
jgi:hypothetical protein